MSHRITATFALGLIPLMVATLGCKPEEKPDKGEKVLIVSISRTDVSEVSMVRASLEKGGMVTLNSSVATQIDPLFEEKYTVSNNQGSYLVKPAILNFIGGQGWHLKQQFCINLNYDNCEYIFVKPR